MGALNLQTRKLNAIEYLAVMQDEKIFEKIENLINKSRLSVHPVTKRLSRKEMIARAEKSETDIAQNNVVSQEDLEKESQLW